MTRVVQVSAVEKSFGVVRALAGVTLDVRQGELLAVLGPSGCGKTTLLRVLAGLERVDAGSISLAGRLVAGPGVHVPAHRRGAAIVPQEAALFPHLSVEANVAFGLQRAGRQARVAEVLELVGLAGYGGRMPHELSGGQQQRVAVARALAPKPSLVLLDEPFSALDATLRGTVRAQVREALKADGATALMVTHDQGEALSVADRIAVMDAGRLRQLDVPAEVYHHPNDSWVAGFVGEANVWPVSPDVAGQAPTPLGPVAVEPRAPGANGVMVRPEQVRLTHTGPVTGTVTEVAYHGHDALVALRLADGSGVLARLGTHDEVPVAGEVVGLEVFGQGHLLHLL